MEFLDIDQIAKIIIGMLFLASIVAILVRRFHIPYTVTLVVVGLAAALLLVEGLPGFFDVDTLRSLLVPEVIMALLVPPLLFEAATHIRLRDLTLDLPLILAFAIPGMVLTMLLVGAIVFWGTPLSWGMALVFGALISATDPVAVVALFRSLGVSKRLTILLEGESLFNDGTAIVVYNLMIAMVLGAEKVTATNIVISFITVAGGGFVVGALVSSVIARIIQLVDDHLIEITLTAVAAYGSYLIAESFHVSGVLAVVAAGLVTGSIGPRGMSPTTRISLFNFWEFAAFFANSLVFLVIGLVIDLQGVIAHFGIIMLAIIAVLLARAVIIYSFALINRRIETRLQHVLWWGGLRGAISLALALGLPQTLNKGLALMNSAQPLNNPSLAEMASLIQVMAYGVVLFTLLVQGTTMRSLVTRLQLAQHSPSEAAYEQHHARTVSARAAYNRLKNMFEEGLISQRAWELMEVPMRRMIDTRIQSVGEILHHNRSVEVAELSRAYEEALRAQRSAYNRLHTAGVISEESFSHLLAEVDSALLNQEVSYGDLMIKRSPTLPPITHMIAAVIKEDDISDAQTLLNVMGIPTTQLESTMGVRKQRYLTLLMGVEKRQIEEVVTAIVNCCSEPPEFTSPLMTLLPGPTIREIDINNTTVYVIEIEHYEEF